MVRRYLAVGALLLAAGCTHVVVGNTRVTTFGTAHSKVTMADGTTVESLGDGTNVFGIVAKIVDAARRFFGGGDTIIQTGPIVPGAEIQPPAAPPSPRVLDRWVS